MDSNTSSAEEAPATGHAAADPWYNRLSMVQGLSKFVKPLSFGINDLSLAAETFRKEFASNTFGSGVDARGLEHACVADKAVKAMIRQCCMPERWIASNVQLIASTLARLIKVEYERAVAAGASFLM